VNNDDIHVQLMGCEYVLSPFAARKLRESLQLAVSLMGRVYDDDVQTPLHPAVKDRWVGAL
jgi:hypothetical protein